MQGKNVIDCATAAPILTFFPVNIRLYITVFLYPATQKVARYYVIPSEPFECPFVRPSELRFRTLTLVVFDRFSSNFAWTLISGRSGLGWQCFFFVKFEQRYGPCLTSDFLCSISCELICKFHQILYMHWYWRNVDLGWLNNMFRSLLIELWPLIDIDILFMLNILWTN